MKDKTDGNQEHQHSSSALWCGRLLAAANVCVRVYCGLYMIIADCDETYNYWEPLNLIYRGFGKQTWEYSPTYAIRSYAYLVPYYLLTWPLRDVQLFVGPLPPYVSFYAVRIVTLCGFTAIAELRLHRAVARAQSQATANWFLLFSTFAPGMSHASVALLPSSFALGWATLGTAFLLDTFAANSLKVFTLSGALAVACFLTAGLVGWPFALVLGVPFGLWALFQGWQRAALVGLVWRCALALGLIAAVLVAVDSYMYGRPLFVPLNIVLYNVFSGEGEGPEIFGVEPFSYYVKNLVLNFSVVFPLAALGLLSSTALAPLVTTSVPLLAWSIVFALQPHKEERFLYPVYTMICLSAARFTALFFQGLRKILVPKMAIFLATFLCAATYTVVSVLRILHLVYNYGAPLNTAHVLYADSLQGTNDIQNVCVGREWYHFPTSFFLPDNYRLRFVQSGFDGLLPGEFLEGAGLQAASSAFPAGMNSKNIFSPDKVVPFADCDYYIDNSLPVDGKEPKVITEKDGVLSTDPNWTILLCEKIVKPEGAHSGVGRILYVPEWARFAMPYNVEKMEYCVLKRR